MIHFLIDWVAYWMVLGATFVTQRLPLGVALALSRFVAGLLYFFHKRSRMAYTNLKAAFPESTSRQRREWVFEMYRQLGMTAVEMMRTPILKKEELDRFIGTDQDYENYVRHRKSGKGLILLTAHMGNWELSQIFEGLRGRPMMVLARKQKYKRLDTLLNSFRQYHGAVAVGKGAGTRDLIRTLRQGGCVGVLGDQSGDDEGVWIRFFGRLTPSPRGPIALGLKLGVKVLPVVIVRRGHTPYHNIVFEPKFELEQTGDWERDVQANTQKYIRILESFISKYPSQWLWGHKRWKRTRTKRITLLSDGRPGHVKQSEALVKEVVERGSRAYPPYETQVEKIEVEFRSSWRRRLFPIFALLFLPWAQGHLHRLRSFFTRETSEKLERTNPDLVVSAGARLVPLNLCLAGENLAKSAVVMKPSFPFNFFRYDLALIPAHDRGFLPFGHFRIQGALGRVDGRTLEDSKIRLAATLRNPEKIRFSLFLGGQTRRFKLSPSDVENLLAQIERVAKRVNGDYLVTTSRRTPEDVNRFLRERLKQPSHCQLCVIASEDRRPEVVPGMMALADFLIVTEDSLSMISEALSSGKRVVVVKAHRNSLPRKHYRFQEILRTEWGVPVVEIEKLSEVLARGEFRSPRRHLEEERSRIQERVGSLF